MINAIKNNPFRVLGLTATASDKEITKRISELEVYIKMGKRIKYNTDFPFLGELRRTSETIQEASNKINKPKNKLFYSLFWFEGNNKNDKLALEELKRENIDDALNIWGERKHDKIPADEHFSISHNLSVLYLWLSFSEDEFNDEYFGYFFIEIGKIFKCHYLEKYVKKVAGVKYFLDRNKIVKYYFDEICKIMSKYLFLNIEENREYIEAFIDSFSNYPEEIQQNISDKYTKKTIKSIEKEIESCRENREKYPEDANEYGLALFFDTKEYLVFLKNVLTISDIRYQTIADKLAEEIHLCSVVYFNRYITSDDGIDPCEESLELSEYADSISVSERIKEKIRKELKVFQTWETDKEEREKQKQVDYHLNFIREEIDNLPNLEQQTIFDEISNYPNILEKFILKCKIHLSELKTLLGVLDTLYWEIINSVVDNALNLVIKYTNETNDTTKVVFLLDDLANIDMNGETKERFYKNMEIIENNHRLYLEWISKLEKEKTKKKKWGWIITVIIFSIIVLTAIISNDDDESNTSEDYHSPVENILEKSEEESKYKGNQLENGASPYNSYFGYGIYNKNYLNEITFKNGYSTDAIVCLVNYYTDKTIRNEYIRKNTNFKMTNIPNGTYYIKVFSGNDWNPEKILANGKIRGGFETDISYNVSDDQDDLIKLEQTEDYSEIQYSIYTITLYQVAYGNMESEPISEKDFFK